MENKRLKNPLIKFVVRSRFVRFVLYSQVVFVVMFGGAIGYFFGLKYWLEFEEMKKWVEVPATVVSTEMESKKRDNKPYYRVIAEYEYEYQGQKYSGARVNVSESFDSDLKKQETRHDELAECVESGKLFRCYVNPGSPEESILYRTVVWGHLIMPLVVMINAILIGLITIFGMRWLMRNKHRFDPSLVEEAGKGDQSILGG